MVGRRDKKTGLDDGAVFLGRVLQRDRAGVCRADGLLRVDQVLDQGVKESFVTGNVRSRSGLVLCQEETNRAAVHRVPVWPDPRLGAKLVDESTPEDMGAHEVCEGGQASGQRGRETGRGPGPAQVPGQNAMEGEVEAG